MTQSNSEQAGDTAPEDAASLLTNLVNILNFVVEGEAAPVQNDTTVGDIITDRGISPAALVGIVQDQYPDCDLDEALIQPEDTLATLSWRVHKAVTGEADF
jgi:hypothetical protein